MITENRKAMRNYILISFFALLMVGAFAQNGKDNGKGNGGGGTVTPFNMGQCANAPIGTDGSRCGTGTVTISTDAPPSGYIVKWYATPTSTQNLSDGGNIFVTPSISSTTQYYATFYNTSTGCETARTTVTANVAQITTANAGSTQSACGSVTLGANTPSSGTGSWSVASGPNTSTSQFSSVTNPTATFTPAGAGGAYTLTWTITNGSCSSSSNVSITVYATPTSANSGAYQNGSSTCGLTTVTLAANSPSVGSGSWSLAGDSPTNTGYSFGNTSSATSSFSGLAGSTYNMVWTISNGFCSSSSETSVTFNRNPTTANAGLNQTICVTGTANLGANSPSVGSGAWSVTSGPSTSTSQFSSTTNPAAVFTPAGGAGTYVLTWTISNAPCNPSSSNATITVNAVPTTANAGPSQTNTLTCGLTTVTLAANSPSVGSGSWSVVSGSGGSFGNASSPTSTFSGTAGTAYTIKWTISNGPCAASTSNTNITFNRNPTPANAGPDNYTCGTTSIALAANAPTVGTGSWSIVSGSGGNVQNASDPASTFTGTAGSTYTLRWTIINSPCTNSTDDVIITFYQTPTTSNAGPDQTGAATCGLTSVTLAANTPSAGTGSWSIVSGSGGTVTTPSSATSTFSGTAGSTYTLRWTISNGPCTASTDDVVITFNRNPSTAVAGADQTGSATCGLTTVTLAATAPTVGTGTWSLAVDSPTQTGWSFGNTSSPTSTFTGTAGATYDIVWTVANSPCTASTSEKMVTFNRNPTTANAGLNQTICVTGTVNLGANSPSVGSGAWSVTSGPSTSTSQFSSTTNPAAVFTPAGGAGTYVLTWTISNAPCNPSSSNATITVNAVPTTANAGPSQTNTLTCGLTTVTLAANSPSVGTGSWSVVSGSGGSFGNASSPTSTFSGTAGTAYTIKWTISNGPCTASTSNTNITFNRNPTPANAGPDNYTCGTTSIALAANTPSVGTGSWSIVSGLGGNVQSVSDPASTFTGTAGSTYTLRWTIINSPCTNSTDDVIITFYQTPTTSNAGPDQTSASTCGLTSVTLAANAPSVGTGVWSIVSGTGGTITTPSSRTSAFSGTAGSTYTLRWTISNGPCTASTDDVLITFNRNPSTAVAGADQTGSATCGLTTVTLAATAPTVGTGTWSLAVDSPTQTGWSFGNTSSPTSTFTGTAGATYDIVWTVANSPCTASTSEKMVTFNVSPTVAVTPSSVSVCSNYATSLAISNPNNISGTTFAWTVVRSNINIPSATSGSSITGNFYSADGITNGTATYTITPTAGICIGTPVTATVTVKPTPTPPAGHDAFIGYLDNPALMQVTVPLGYKANWYLDKSQPPVYVGPTYSTYAGQPHVFYVSIQNTDVSNQCESTKTPVVAEFTNQVPFVASMKQEIPRDTATTDARVTALVGPAQKTTNITYVDGLARAVQSITLNASPTGKDVVQPVEYDAFGRTSKDYLPYTVAGTNGNFQSGYAADQNTFYNTSGDKVADDTYPFAIAKNEQSPLGRVLEQGGVGGTWQPVTQQGQTAHTKRVEYSYNTGATSDDLEEVRTYVSDAMTSFFAANTLSRTKVTDENGNLNYVFTDDLGHTIVRKQYLNGTIIGSAVSYLHTYYVYDSMNRLKYIIPPGGFAAVKNNGYAVTQTIKDQHFHQFLYDTYGRLVQKKTPGQAWSYFVYDPLGRLTLSQDGNLRPTNQWAFVKYDRMGRTVETGLYTNSSLTSQATAQSAVNTFYANASNPTFEQRAGNHWMGYTHQSFPTDTTVFQILSVNYFDDYGFKFNNNLTPTYSAGDLQDLPPSTITSTRGLLTGSKKLILGTSNWIVTALFYDSKGRVIQTQGNTHLNLGTIERSSVTYYFEGTVKQTKNTHYPDLAHLTQIVQTPIYDTQGRLSQVKHNIIGAPEQIVAQYQYNELGQVVMKQLHNTGGSYLQNVDYRYNIKGWLTSINNAQLADDGSTTNGDTNDYFGMEMNYHTDAGNGNNLYYNGNVSSIKWKGIGDATVTPSAQNQRSYKYVYDLTDKLTNATFQKSDGSAWTKEQNTLNETMGYDHNGNILSLQRKQNVHGLSGTTVTSTANTIDDLTYTYANGNQLSKVSDASANGNGFNDGTNQTTEYNYDTHGNLTSDLNKGISAITYNVLGKAQQITFTDGRVVNYTYDADGNKLKMAANVGGTTTTTEYADGFVYTTINNGTRNLSFISSPEGRVVKNGNSYEYQYAIADHQGNTRVLFTSAAQTPKATLADFDGDANDQSSQFTNVPAPIPYGAANHTPGGSKVIRMNQSNPVGPGFSKKVFPGDKVDMEVYSYYEAGNGYGTTNTAVATIISAVTGALVNGGPDYGGLKSNGVNSALTNFGTGANQGDGAPAAFLNYILFDQNYNVMDAGWQVVPATSFSKQYVSIPTITVKEVGYIFAYLSYEDQSNNYVYFDDFKVTVTPTPVVQSNDYYAFGLQHATSWTRDTATPNNFLYNEANELNSTTGMYDLPYRNYDASLGRFFQVDPLSVFAHDFSPYQYAYNDPIGNNDPSGLMVPGSISTWNDGQRRAYYYSHEYEIGYGSFDDWNDTVNGGVNNSNLGTWVSNTKITREKGRFVWNQYGPLTGYWYPGTININYSETFIPHHAWDTGYDGGGYQYSGSDGGVFAGGGGGDGSTTTGPGDSWLKKTWNKVAAFFNEKPSGNTIIPGYTVEQYKADIAANPEFFDTMDDIGMAITFFTPGQSIFNIFRGRLGAQAAKTIVQSELKYARKQMWKKFGEHFKEFGLSHTKEGWAQYLKIAQGVFKSPVIKAVFPAGGKYAGETWMISDGVLLRLDADGFFISLYNLK